MNHLAAEEKSKGCDLRYVLFTGFLSVAAMVALVAGFTVGRK